MVSYSQVEVADEITLRASTPKKFWNTMLSGFLIGAAVIFLAYFMDKIFVGVGYSVWFNLSLITALVVGSVNSVVARVHQGILVLVANLVAFWGFNVNADNLWTDVMVFSVAVMLATGCFYQIFRIRKMWLAVVLAVVLAIMIQLA